MIFIFFNDTATTEIYTLSLHDALPIFDQRAHPLRAVDGVLDERLRVLVELVAVAAAQGLQAARDHRTEEHTSELQSRQYLVCRLLPEKKKIGTASYGYAYC